MNEVINAKLREDCTKSSGFKIVVEMYHNLIFATGST